MGHHASDELVIEKLRNFIVQLNEESERGSVVVVEGRRDARALSRIGFIGNLEVFHNFKGVADFVDTHDHTDRKIILLLDMDRTGKHLTGRIVSQFQARRNNVTLFYKHLLAKITSGKVRHVEDLTIFAPQMSGVTGSRKDLYFYT